MTGNASLKAKLSSIASESNVHGVSRIISDRPIYLRLLWLLAFLGLFGFGFYQVSSIFSTFLQYPTKTDVKVKFDALPFPAITICNMNIMKKSKSGLIQSEKLQQIIDGNYDPYNEYDLDTPAPTPSAVSPNSSNPLPTFWNGGSGILQTTENPFSLDYDYMYDGDFYGMDSSVPVTVNSDYIIKQTFTEEYQQLSRENRTELGHSYDDMMLECTFAGTNCDPVSKTVVTLDYGNCYTLQSARYITGTSGSLGGMSLTINLENHEAFEKMTESFGLRLVIHEVGSFPLPLEKGMTISGGFETSLALKMTRIERQGSPYGECEDPVAYFKKHSVRYSTQSCLQECLETLVFKGCGCNVGYLRDEFVYFSSTYSSINPLPTNSTGNVTVGYSTANDEESTTEYKGCFSSDEKSCYNKLRRDYLRRTSEICTCHPPCFEDSYSASYSGATWPHSIKLDELKNATCDRYNLTGSTPAVAVDTSCPLDSLDENALSSNFLKVHIYFEALNYEEVKEEPLYDANQIIADVGGSLGLCLGFSLLCLFEVFEAILESCRVLRLKITQKNQVKSKPDLS